MGAHEAYDSGREPVREPRGLVRYGIVLLLVAVSMNLSALTAVVVILRRQAFSALIGRWMIPVVGLTVVGAGMALLAFFLGLSRWRDGRWIEASLLTIRVFAYCLACAWLTVVFVVQPINPSASARLVAGLGAALFGFAVLLRIRAGRSQPSRVVRILDLVACNLCIVLVVAEGGLRLLAEIHPSVLLMRPGTGVAENLAAVRYAPGTIRHGFPVNSSGYYDEELTPQAAAEKRLIVSVGDSFSASIVHHSLHFTTVAEDLLEDVTIYNMGCPSIGPREYQYIVAHDALPLQPRMIIVNLFIGNDLYYPLPSVEEYGPIPSLFDPGQLLSVLVPQRLLRVARSGTKGVETLDGRIEGTAEDPIARTPDEVREMFPWTADPFLEEPRMDEGHFVRVERRSVERFAEMSRAEIVRRIEPLTEIVAMAREIPVAVMIIPDRFQIEDDLWIKVRTEEIGNEERLRPLAIVRDWLDEQGIPYLDLYPALRAAPPMRDGSRHLYHRCDTHFNARGNRVAGEALATFLASQLDAPR